MSNDIVRFMDEHKLTLATIGGHGFGAKVAAATAINHTNRFTGVINLDGGPIDHRYYEAYQELAHYVEEVRNLHIEKLSSAEAIKKVHERVAHPKWRSIILQNIQTDKGSLQWKCNLGGLYKNTKKYVPDVAYWGPSYGLWPGQTLALFAAASKWVHLNTNTLQFYNVYPRLQGQFPQQISTHGSDDFDSPLNHWMHEEPSDQVWYLSQKMHRWLRWKDGCNLLLADKSEAGWYFVPDRGFDTITNTTHGEYTPEHVHHNYLYTNAYEKSRQARGKEGASHGQFLPVGQFSPKDKWF
jgi:pimeloyl-ACP methyl ester carboxylesterase